MIIHTSPNRNNTDCRVPEAAGAVHCCGRPHPERLPSGAYPPNSRVSGNTVLIGCGRLVSGIVNAFINPLDVHDPTALGGSQGVSCLYGSVMK